MNIIVIKSNIKNYQDIHGGECASTKVEIEVDSSLRKRVQRNLVIHAVIEVFCRPWTHDKVEELTDYICDALDEL